ncbi:MAG TPA: PilZ domain-containing protein [Geobacteraceae bacterium]|nr:PilZ domain-containing protein [Geobacteraceae bacterium]
MAEKRNLGRHRKRFSLRFGIGEPVKLAFTEDISSTGLFIKTASTCNPGTIVTVELELGGGITVTLEAQVMWAKKVPPQMIHLVKKSGMGVRIIRFVSGEAEYSMLCEELELPLISPICE